MHLMICFVILHYITINETINCVDSIIANINCEKKIIIVDNNSPNNSGSTLKEKYRMQNQCIVIKSNHNSGFAIGNNIGYKYAKENFNPAFIVLLNNDIEISDKLFDKKIWDIYNKEHFFILGPDIFSKTYEIHQSPKCLTHYTLDKMERLHSHYKKIFKYKIILYIKCILKRSRWIKKLVYKYRRSKIDHRRIYYNVPLHGACLIFSNKFITRFDEVFLETTFFYFESEILDYKCYIKDLKTMYSPEIQVFHHQNMTTDEVYADVFERTKFAYKCNIESSKAFIDYIRNCTPTIIE